jgi:hypothetical protein
MLFLEQVCGLPKLLSQAVTRVQAWDKELQRLLGEQAALQQMAASAGALHARATRTGRNACPGCCSRVQRGRSGATRRQAGAAALKG